MTLSEMAEFADNATWTFAKTMPQWPHWYTVRNQNDPLDFEAFLHGILYYGDIRTMEKRFRRIYLDIGEYTYWWMGAPLRKARIINRALLEPDPICQ